MIVYFLVGIAITVCGIVWCMKTRRINRKYSVVKGTIVGVEDANYSDACVCYPIIEYICPFSQEKKKYKLDVPAAYTINRIGKVMEMRCCKDGDKDVLYENSWGTVWGSPVITAIIGFVITSIVAFMMLTC